MADIIALKDVKERRPRAAAAEPSSSFQLLFFTGVRYERPQITHVKPTQKRTPRLKRKEA